MTSRREPGLGGPDDAARAAIAPLLSDLRTDLLVMPSEEVVEHHVEMMAFEQRVLATPRLVRRTPSSLVRPRRTAFVIACVCATIASCGLSAAGALPEPLQHITDSIAHTLGVPKPHDAPTAPHSAAAGPLPTTTTAPAANRPTTTPTGGTSTTPHPATSDPATKHKARSTTHPKATPTVGVTAQKSPKPPYTRPRPTVGPAKRLPPKHNGPSPSKNSDNTPAGYPTNWRKDAIKSATARLEVCAQAQSLTEAGCPQQAIAFGENAQAQAVQWSLLNQPQTTAVTIAQTRRNAAGKLTTTVTVYEPFQMEGSYTEASAPRVYLAYSSGIAQATMTWNGSTFTNVTFSAGSSTDILPGVKVASFERPAGATDGAALAAVQSGFENCVAIMAPAANPIPSCATGAASADGQWTLVGDPTQGAVVQFNPAQGDFTVTGSYAMTSASDAGGSGGSSVAGHYTATLFFDGRAMQVLSITAGP